MKPVATAIAVACALCLAVAAARPAAAAAESMDAVEKDIASALKEMDALSKELDRIEEIARAPKATLLRVEIHPGTKIPAPVSVRIYLENRLEDEREWSRGEREAFSGSAPSPLVLQIPYFPGTFPARIELFHPAWPAPAAAAFQAALKSGESTAVPFRLLAPVGNAAPQLAPAGAPAR